MDLPVAGPLFLISLKAGDLGLNLNAVDYVFILESWWNPPVEAQALGRATYQPGAPGLCLSLDCPRHSRGNGAAASRHQAQLGGCHSWNQ